METRFADAAKRRRFDPSQSGLPGVLAAYAGLLSSVGLGFLISPVYLLPLTAAFIVLALAALVLRATKRRGYGPFVVGLVAGSAVLLGKFAWASHLTMYSALGLMVISSSRSPGHVKN